MDWMRKAVDKRDIISMNGERGMEGMNVVFIVHCGDHWTYIDFSKYTTWTNWLDYRHITSDTTGIKIIEIPETS